MGNPNTGEIYEGMLRNEGDVPLDAQQAEWLRSLPVRDRMSELKEMARKLQSGDFENEPKPFFPPLSSGVTREMPRYKCHKEVWALKIERVIKHAHPDPNADDAAFEASPEFQGAHLFPEDKRYAPIPVSADYYRKHNPAGGGYYVRYKDGYESYSPAQAFEEGYTRL